MKSTIINTNNSSNRKDKNEETKMQDKCLGSRSVQNPVIRGQLHDGLIVSFTVSQFGLKCKSDMNIK